MTPKEKANQLIEEFYDNNTDYIDSNRNAMESAITCAIVCVDTIIGTLKSYKFDNDIDDSAPIEYYKKVKIELENT